MSVHNVVQLLSKDEEIELEDLHGRAEAAMITNGGYIEDESFPADKWSLLLQVKAIQTAATKGKEVLVNKVKCEQA